MRRLFHCQEGLRPTDPKFVNLINADDPQGQVNDDNPEWRVNGNEVKADDGHNEGN